MKFIPLLSSLTVLTASPLAFAQAEPAAAEPAAAEPAAAAPAPAAEAPTAAAPAPEPAPQAAPGSTEDVPADDGPRMNLTVAPPAPALQRKAYSHEGFYLGVNVGPGWMYSAINNTDDSGPDVESHAFALGADLMVGGSPSPGMALGAGVQANLGFGSNFQENGTTIGSGTIFHFLAGPFFDAFPNDKDGWHLGTMLGFAGMTQSSGIAGVADSAFGGGASAFAGYDMWVAPEWSAGFELRAGGAYMVAEQSGAGVFNALFLVTILNH